MLIRVCNFADKISENANSKLKPKRSLEERLGIHAEETQWNLSWRAWSVGADIVRLLGLCFINSLITRLNSFIALRLKSSCVYSWIEWKQACEIMYHWYKFHVISQTVNLTNLDSFLKFVCLPEFPFQVVLKELPAYFCKLENFTVKIHRLLCNFRKTVNVIYIQRRLFISSLLLFCFLFHWDQSWSCWVQQTIWGFLRS